MMVRRYHGSGPRFQRTRY